MTKVFEDDVRLLAESKELGLLDNATILVTGSTGLIGMLFVKGMLAYNDAHDGHIRVLALARNKQKAESIFGDAIARDDFELVIGDTGNLPEITEDIDWISHGASITSSAAFANTPVEVSWTELQGMRNILELAKKKQVRGVVYLSSLEVYGDVPEEHGDVREDYCGPLDRFVTRNSYPVSKRMCESLCASYAKEYGVPVKIARLAQTFGAGVSPADNRVFAYFAKCIIAGEDIVMRTPGLGCRCYCYTADAVRGLATILVKGTAGEAYNLSNPDTYCNVRDMAGMVSEAYGAGKTHVVFDIPEDASAYGFAAPSFVKLNSDKLMDLGWKAQFGLRDMYGRLIEDLRLG